MNRPFRRFCFSLAKELGVSVHQVFSMTSREIMEWAAFFMTQDDKWVERYNNNVELERQRQMSPEEKKALFQSILGGVNNG
jgi:hypothetical protein